MAYGTKYRATITRGAFEYHLFIKERDFSGTPQEIMNIVDLRLGFVGQNAPDEPIVKTELTLTLVDAPDLEYGTNQKGGNWQEFYTQDATLYKVEIQSKKAGTQTSPVTRWTGYVTPDSWSEELKYHGTVSIIARDNIGHLQDFQFSEQFANVDTFRFSQLVTTAGNLIGQTFTFGTDSVNLLNAVCETSPGASVTTPVKDIVMYTAAFEGDNVYQVLEKILQVLGMTLRWFDKNIFGIVPIGYITNDTFGTFARGSASNILILNQSGVYSINPAYREIIDDIKYDFRDEQEPDFVNGPYGSNLKTQASLSAYENAQYTNGALCLAVANTPSTSYDIYAEGIARIPKNTKFKISYELMGGFFATQFGSTRLVSGVRPIQFYYRIVWVDGSTVQHYNPSTGAWEQNVINILSDSSTPNGNYGYTSLETVEITTPNSNGYLAVRLLCTYKWTSSLTSDWFGCIRAITVQYTVTNKTVSERVRTVNDTVANVSLERDSDVGQYVGLPSSACCVKNAMFGGTTQLPYGIIGLNKTTDGLTVRYSNIWEYTHRNLLCAYKDNTAVLEGDFIPADSNTEPLFYKIWQYTLHGTAQQFYLCGGKLNILNGHIEGAVLRQIAAFNDLYPDS